MSSYAYKKIPSNIHSAVEGSNRRFLIVLIMGLITGFGLAKLFVFLTYEKPDWMLNRRYQHENFNDANRSYDMLAADVLRNFMDNHEHEYENSTIATKLYNEIRVLCLVVTNPENHQEKAIHIKRTWGKRCNKLLFMSTAEDAELNSIALNVSEGRNNLWAKTKEAFRYVYENHFHEADWFLKTHDDTYVIVENLRYMLYPYSPETAIYFGCRLKHFVKQGYMLGGAGYVLSKEALRRFIVNALPNPKFCSQQNDVYEDVEMGKCLEKVKVKAGDSRDSQARERFFFFMPEQHLFPDPKQNSWYWDYIFYKSNEGLGSLSDTAVTFHYVSPHEMYILDYFIYHLQPYAVVSLPEALPERLKKGKTMPPLIIPHKVSNITQNLNKLNHN